MKRKMTTVFIRCGALAASISLALAYGCGSGTTTQQSTSTAGPSGRTFSGDIKFYDGAPSLSTDGLKLAFESGRENSSLRIFKVNIPADPAQGGASTDTPSRLTSDDTLSSETTPMVSPDGTRVTFIGGKADGSRCVYATPWAGGTTSQLSQTSELAFSHASSPDSGLVAYAARFDAGTNVIVVDPANTSSRATLPTGSRVVTGVRWLRAGAGYKLATVSLVELSGQSFARIESWTFNGIGDVTTAAPSIVTDKALMSTSDDINRWVADNGTSILAVKGLSPSSERSVSETGAGALADRRIFARNDLLMIDPASSVDTVMDTPAGSSITSVAASTGATLLVTTEVTRCVADGLTARVTTMKLSATPATAASYERLVVRKTSTDLTFDVVSDPCDTTMSGEGVVLDLTPGDAIISDSATTTSLTAAYISIITGDPEVIIIRRGSGVSRAWDASNNKI